MRNLIIGILLGLIGCAGAQSYFYFQSQRTMIEGVDCIVVKLENSVGVSCDWNK